MQLFNKVEQTAEYIGTGICNPFTEGEIQCINLSSIVTNTVDSRNDGSFFWNTNTKTRKCVMWFI